VQCGELAAQCGVVWRDVVWRHVVVRCGAHGTYAELLIYQTRARWCVMELSMPQFGEAVLWKQRSHCNSRRWTQKRDGEVFCGMPYLRACLAFAVSRAGLLAETLASAVQHGHGPRPTSLRDR
jgi:hypothetical protein